MSPAPIQYSPGYPDGYKNPAVGYDVDSIMGGVRYVTAGTGVPFMVLRGSFGDSNQHCTRGLRTLSGGDTTISMWFYTPSAPSAGLLSNNFYNFLTLGTLIASPQDDGLSCGVTYADRISIVFDPSVNNMTVYTTSSAPISPTSITRIGAPSALITLGLRWTHFVLTLPSNIDVDSVFYKAGTPFKRWTGSTGTVAGGARTALVLGRLTIEPGYDPRWFYTPDGCGRYVPIVSYHANGGCCRFSCSCAMHDVFARPVGLLALLFERPLLPSTSCAFLVGSY